MTRQQVRLDDDVVDFVQQHNEDGLSLSGATNRLLRTLRTGAAARPPVEPSTSLVASSAVRAAVIPPRLPSRRFGSPVGALARRARQPVVVPQGGLVVRPKR